MGEPLANYAQVVGAVRRLTDRVPDGLGISRRAITVSTVGLVPAIGRLTGEGLPVRLAVSLHAPDDGLRDELVPVNKRWKVDEVLSAAWGYAAATGRRVSIEYALIRDVNDQPWRADALGRLLAGRPAHVNLIPLNPTPGSQWDASPKPVEREFSRLLAAHGVAGGTDGLLRLETPDGSIDIMRATARKLGLPEDYVRVVTQEEASALAGVAIAAPAWFYPGGGWVEPGGLARSFLERAAGRVELRLGAEVAIDYLAEDFADAVELLRRNAGRNRIGLRAERVRWDDPAPLVRQAPAHRARGFRDCTLILCRRWRRCCWLGALPSCGFVFINRIDLLCC